MNGAAQQRTGLTWGTRSGDRWLVRRGWRERAVPVPLFPWRNSPSPIALDAGNPTKVMLVWPAGDQSRKRHKCRPNASYFAGLH